MLDLSHLWVALAATLLTLLATLIAINLMGGREADRENAASALRHR